VDIKRPRNEAVVPNYEQEAASICRRLKCLLLLYQLNFKPDEVDLEDLDNRMGAHDETSASVSARPYESF